MDPATMVDAITVGVEALTVIGDDRSHEIVALTNGVEHDANSFGHSRHARGIATGDSGYLGGIGVPPGDDP
jgi:hypothetical protein